jgi:hypothetical protein
VLNIAAAKPSSAANVHFERYPGIPQDDIGSWTSPVAARSCGSRILTTT